MQINDVHIFVRRATPYNMHVGFSIHIGGEPMAQILAIGTTRAEQIPLRFSLRTT